MTTTKIERAGILFEFSFFDDSDERGPATGFDLQGAKLVDPAEFTACTELPATPENVAAYVKANEDEAGEDALERAMRDGPDFDEPDPEPF